MRRTAGLPRVHPDRLGPFPTRAPLFCRRKPPLYPAELRAHPHRGCRRSVAPTHTREYTGRPPQGTPAEPGPR
jgi:hypothetical protein